MSNLGKKVIVRANGAGVFFGTLTAKEDCEVIKQLEESYGK